MAYKSTGRHLEDINCITTLSDATYRLTLKFQVRSSINVRLTENSLCNRFCIERSTKMGFWGDFAARGNYIRPKNCAFSDIFGPDLTRRAVAFCRPMEYGYNHLT